MAILRFCLLLVVLCVKGGQGKTSGDSFCTYTFKVPATECGPSTIDDRFMKSSMIALQSQMTQMKKDIRKLTEENQTLRKKTEAGNTIMLRSIINLYVAIPIYIPPST